MLTLCNIVLTGSFNWTRSARREDQENIAVVTHAAVVRQFVGEFDRLWEEFAAFEIRND